jgi:hypothetical protein
MEATMKAMMFLGGVFLALVPTLSARPLAPSPQGLCCLCTPIQIGGQQAWSCPCFSEFAASFCRIDFDNCDNVGTCP